MKNLFLKHISVAIVFVLMAQSAIFAQGGRSAIEEKNVRAEMGFLAGDAMQGRGSGTIFERIAAEYIGSQFMQFGLEPAGEVVDGKPTFVQTVEVPGREVVSEIKFDAAGTQLVFGTDVIAFSVNSKQISGPLQKLKPGDSATKGSVVLLMLAPDDKFDQDLIGKFQKEGAVAIVITEIKEIRDSWSSVAGRKLSISRRGSNLFAVSSTTAAKLGALSDGASINISSTAAASGSTFTWNAMGKITGTDKTLSAEVILLTSHLDHLGVRESTPGDDKIFNGADDDASGSVAVLELARVLGSGAKPKRTVYFVCFGSEESGGHGARYFVDNMPFPKDKLLANLEFEMIGRPDSKVKPEELWLTGYERSDLGPELAKRGAKLVQDPHPEEKFFQRSDNIQLARAGIIAHTVSSFGLHTDYHHASDEVKTIDFSHMTRSINSMVAPIDWLINSNFKPVWNSGMKP